MFHLLRPAPEHRYQRLAAALLPIELSADLRSPGPLNAGHRHTFSLQQYCFAQASVHGQDGSVRLRPIRSLLERQSQVALKSQEFPGQDYHEFLWLSDFVRPVRRRTVPARVSAEADKSARSTESGR